jgi:hypothetical protein
VYRVFQCAAAQYTLLGTFSKIDHNLRQKARTQTTKDPTENMQTTGG